MIMGNIDIALPEGDIVPSDGIPVATPPESRSVLKDVTASERSPRALTVLPAYGTRAHKTKNNYVTASAARDITATVTANQYSNQISGKRTLSWADIARK